MRENATKSDWQFASAVKCLVTESRKSGGGACPPGTADAMSCGCCGGDTPGPARAGARPAPGAWLTREYGAIFGLVFLSAAFAVHAFEHGFLAALTSHGGDLETGIPPSAIALFVLSIAFSYWYVAPKALVSIRRLRPDMNLLMTVAVIGACILGDWFEGATVAWLFALALLLEKWSVGRARRAIEALLDLAPPTARYIDPGEIGVIEKPVAEVPPGATVLVKPGERIPLDGVVTKGETSVNQSPITGESEPVFKTGGDEVFAGTINNEGAFEFRATKNAGETVLARIIKMVEEAQGRRAETEKWIEKFARYYTPAVFGFAAAVAAIPPLFTGGFADWFYRALVILVIACPCALVISTPVSIVAGLATAARRGVLIKGGVFLELPARIKVIAFDKTGTLTKGEPQVVGIIPLNNHSDAELLERSAALEALSEHPFGRAIVERAYADGVAFSPADGLTAFPGRGAEGDVKGKRYWIGSHRLMHERGFEMPAVCDRANELESEGKSVVAVGTDGHVCGIIGISDAPRESARESLAALKKAGVERLIMLTGDNGRAAGAIAAKIGIDEVHASLLPEGKMQYVAGLAVAGNVAMVGDGVNDAPALAAANLGIAMGAAGTDAAIETADVALMSDDLSKLAWLITHSKRTLGIIKQNVVFALGVKAAFLLLAIFGISTLWMAILADMGASLIVIGNGLRLLSPGGDSSGRKI